MSVVITSAATTAAISAATLAANRRADAACRETMATFIPSYADKAERQAYAACVQRLEPVGDSISGGEAVFLAVFTVALIIIAFAWVARS